MGEESLFCLRNQVNILQQELEDVKDESEKAKNQLSCLLTLVKRSWLGDVAAQIHLSNIVGVPLKESVLASLSTESLGPVPPACSAQGDLEKHDHMLQLQSRAISNWESVVKRCLRKLKDLRLAPLREQQAAYLSQRETYLTEILDSGDQEGDKMRRALNLIDLNFLNTYQSKYSKPKTKRVVSAGVSRSLTNSTQKPANKSRPHTAKDANSRALVPVHDTSHDRSVAIDFYTNSLDDLADQSYDNPKRYQTSGLFTIRQSQVTKKSHEKRPVSRPRPHTSVTHRPLPSETTFPVERPPTLTHSPHDLDPSSPTNLCAPSPQPSDNRKPNPPKNQQLFDFVNVTQRQKLENLQLEQDMLKLTETSNDFKRNILDLQEKLGITHDGCLY